MSSGAATVNGFFDQLTDEEVTDSRIRPAFSRAENEAIGLHSGKHLFDGTDRIACGYGRSRSPQHGPTWFAVDRDGHIGVFDW